MKYNTKKIIAVVAGIVTGLAIAQSVTEDGQDTAPVATTTKSVARIVKMEVAFDMEGNVVSVTCPVHRFKMVDNDATVSSLVGNVSYTKAQLQASGPVRSNLVNRLEGSLPLIKIDWRQSLNPGS